MSSDTESESKPAISKKPKTTRKKRKQDDEEEEDFKPSPAAKRARSVKEPRSPAKRPASRVDAPAFTPETCDPPIASARDPRLTVAILERCIDEMSPELRKNMAKKFGVDPNKLSIAWGDTIKYKVKRDIRQVMLGGTST